jgi:hypothetical protein
MIVSNFLKINGIMGRTSIHKKDWIEFNGTFPNHGHYEVKINGKILKGGSVKVINTYEGDDPNKELRGFCISTLLMSESDRREAEDWILKSDYIFLKNVTHYKESSYEKELRYIDGYLYKFVEMSDFFVEQLNLDED